MINTYNGSLEAANNNRFEKKLDSVKELKYFIEKWKPVGIICDEYGTTKFDRVALRLYEEGYIASKSDLANKIKILQLEGYSLGVIGGALGSVTQLKSIHKQTISRVLIALKKGQTNFGVQPFQK